MGSRPAGSDCRYVVVADENRSVLHFVIQTLTDDGYAVFQAYDGLSAIDLATGLKVCDLVITNTRIGGVAAADLIADLRVRLPDVPVLYLAHPQASTPALERRLPANVPVLREPFTANELRLVVGSLLDLPGPIGGDAPLDDAERPRP